MDVNVKNLDPEVVARLAEQAAAEGVSQQEWIKADPFAGARCDCRRPSCSPGAVSRSP